MAGIGEIQVGTRSKKSARTRSGPGHNGHAGGWRRGLLERPLRWLASVVALAVSMALCLPLIPTAANAAPVGQGFTVTPSDLAFILKQIKIAEAHVANTTSTTGACGALLGTGPDQIESPLLSFGLRTVDGTCNNLLPGQEKFGAADQAFPRLTKPVFKDAEDATAFGGPNPSKYSTHFGAVVDSEPRTVSNLIVDQTSTNPAAVAAAGFPIRSQGNEGVKPCTTEPSTPGGTDGLPAGCVPAHETLDIPNVTTDVGLSPPFNSLFTIFGQFFDHGLDKITNGGNGTVFVPLKADDPLIAGDDHILGTGDDLPVGQRFMVLTRGTNVTGPDGEPNSPNTDSPFVDQSQTYTSHPSHQVFLREYVDNSVGHPVATGKFLSAPNDGLATWAMIKDQARTVLGMELVDADVNNIPMIAADAYGKFLPGPVSGLPQYVTPTGLVEGSRTTPVPVPPTGLRIDTAFLNDIAHSAAPGSIASPKPRDDDLTAGDSLGTPVPAGSYDNELLDIHAICGDGRCNENIALQAIHQVFHNEHDRLVGDIKNVLTTDTSGVTKLADWENALGAVGWNGERLFQAARFVTEMEYQHLVFEEFARKIQPGINPFEPFAFNQTDVNPAITAEFAHAVYRFGHSMLTDSIPRINADGSHNDIALLDGFLNPAAYYKNGTATLSPSEAAGSIIMGLSDQVGQELDEFVVETLRNNLLGLPLDLASLNMARARSEGVPPLNDVRRQIFSSTNDGQLKPYTDWVDFGQQLKHPESLINFVAAYGTHPTITGTLAQRRAAAKLIVNPEVGEVQPRDSADFMFGTNYDETADNTPAVDAIPEGPGPDGILVDDPGTAVDEAADNTPAVDAIPEGPGPDGILVATNDPATNWANVSGRTVTGVDAIDLWVGGLAERTNLFGGLLGSTFNYVFENQLTNLQNGDRFYYLARTPGMNLRAQLEGNSFAELVMRNTNAHTLKADPFATADCKFELQNITWPATSTGSSGKLITGAGSVQDDPKSECDENEHLLRMADGTIRYRMTNTAMPSGINAQAVYNGKSGVVKDRIWGGADNDTFWGGEGNDIVEGGDGADIALGGDGNDIITDLAGDDVPKGGPGNDAIDGGPGLDILMGGDGNDFTNGGANTNETFGGAGDDFAIAGQGLDAILGDSGDDWEEGGDQPDLLIGDSSSLFFDDHNMPGHDILIGQGGDDDYDMEGGDDIGLAGPGIEKTAGASGYDWQIGLGDPQAQDMDLAQVFVAGGVVLPGVRDKFNEVEALSGAGLDDKLRGDDVVPTAVGGGGFVGCDALDASGVARIKGLNELVPTALRTVPSQPIIDASATQHCLITGDVWGAGNILLGGGGSDLLEGRGADDIIDGDRYINVRLSVRSDPTDAGTELGTTDLMENKATSGNFGTGTTGMTLQQAVFAGLVDPGKIVAVREILSSSTGTDTALFSAPLDNYTIDFVDGAVTVTQNTLVAGQRASDGIDTVRNVEALKFPTGNPAPNDFLVVSLAPPAAPTDVAATAGVERATVTWTAPAAGTLDISSFDIVATPATGPTVTTTALGTATSKVVTGLTAGVSYTFTVRAVNAAGPGAFSAPSSAVTPTAPLRPPNQPAAPTATAGVVSATVNWTAPASNGAPVNGGPEIATYEIVANPAAPGGNVTVAGTVTSATVPGLTAGTSYTFRVQAVNADGPGPLSAASNAVTPTALGAPVRPVNAVAVRGNTQVTLSWVDGAVPVSSHRVQIRIAGVVQETRTVGAGSSAIITGLANGTAYTFRVAAVNATATSAFSPASNAATPATVPGAPVIGTAVQGPAGGNLTAVANWTAPATTGGANRQGYRVTATPTGAGAPVTVNVGANAVTRSMVLPAGTYTFTVVAFNAVGDGPASAASNPVTAR